MKTYTLQLVGTAAKNDAIEVTSGLGARGQTLHVQAPPGSRVQLTDLQTQFAPDNIRIKRVGKSLHLAFEGSDIAQPDVIIDNWYDDNAEARLIGQAEDGRLYEYIPETGEAAEYVSNLPQQFASGQILGGPGITLAALPLASAGAGAAGGALTGITPLGWVALGVGGIAAVALAASGGGDGGGGNDGSPAGSVNGRLDPASDSGVVGDGRTSDTTPTLTGTGATPGNTIRVTTPTGEVLTTTVAADGTWSVTPTQALPEGPQTFTIESRTPGGVTVATATLAVTIDSTAPAAATLSLAAASDTGVSSADGLTQDTTPSFVVTPVPGAGETLTLWVDGVAVAATYDAASNTLTPNAPLGEGAHSVTVTLTDAAGNVSAPSAAALIVIDTTAPGAFASTVPEGPTINATEAADGIDVTVALPQNAVAGDVITASIDGSPPVRYTVTADDVVAGTVTVLIPAVDVANAGQRTAVVTTTYGDASGNLGSNSPQTITLDIVTVAPGIYAAIVGEGPQINAAEAADGLPVLFTLPTDAQAGDVITAGIDARAPVSRTLTAADVAAGTVTLLLPAADVAAAGQGAAQVTTTYTRGDGTLASNSPITIGLDIDTAAPATPAR
jgi:large repetitive protein